MPKINANIFNELTPLGETHLSQGDQYYIYHEIAVIITMQEFLDGEITLNEADREEILVDYDIDESTLETFKYKDVATLSNPELNVVSSIIRDYFSNAVDNNLSNIIQVFQLSTRSVLYDFLVQYFGSHDKLMSNLRTPVYIDNNIYFPTGCGYDIISADLLNGSADGNAKKEFLKWCNEN